MLPSAQANFEQKDQSPIAIDLVVETATGEITKKTYSRTPQLFTRYNHNSNKDRFGNPYNYGGERDEHYGGDDWGRPRVIEMMNRIRERALFLEGLNVTPKIELGFRVNDISIMHGGTFPPRLNGHKYGREVDGWIIGFTVDGKPPGAIAARKLLFLLGQLSPELKSNINFILVTYPVGGAFAAELEKHREIQPADVALIKNDQDPAIHKNHFHISFKPRNRD